MQADVKIVMDQTTENVDALYRFVSENIPNVTNDMVDVYNNQKELKDSICKLQSKKSILLDNINNAINDL